MILYIGFWVTVVTLVLGEVKICGANNCHNKKVDLVTEVHCEGVATVGVGRVRFLETFLKQEHSKHETCDMTEMSLPSHVYISFA